MYFNVADILNNLAKIKTLYCVHSRVILRSRSRGKKEEKKPTFDLEKVRESKKMKLNNIFQRFLKTSRNILLYFLKP